MWTPILLRLLCVALLGLGSAPRGQPKVLEGGLKSSRAVLIALHGGSWNRKSSEERARALLNELNAQARRVGVRILVPVLPEEARGWRGETEGPHGVTLHDGSVPWASPPGEQLVREIVARALERERADPERIGLAGHGAGGTAALLIASHEPRTYNGLVLWSSSPAPYIDAQREVIGLVENPVPALRGLGLYLYTGDDDEILDRPAVSLLLKEWDAEVQRDGGRAVINEHGAGGHGFGKHGVKRGLKAFKSWRGHGGSKAGGRERQ